MLSPSTTLDAPATYTNHGLLWHDWNPNGHGVIDLTQAIVQSADTYFYQVGYDFYLRKGTELEDWAKRLGYGHPTGIDIPGESPASCPRRPGCAATYTKKTDPTNWRIDSLWKPGNSINLAIGQGDLLATPLQVAVNYAAIANGGYVVTPHLGLRIDSPQGAPCRRSSSRRRAAWASRAATLLSCATPCARRPRHRPAPRTASSASYPSPSPARPAPRRSPARATTPGMRASRRPTIPSTSWSS